MTIPRLSALDASFLAVETPTAHMHVGWVALFSASDQGRLPSFQQLREHIELRVGRAPRYRQKLASVPLGLHAPEWIDDPAFSVDRHVYWAPGPLRELIDEVMSIPLRRDRPLWEMWICENARDGCFAIVGKTHHCMVDGLAAVELASLLLDPTPETVSYESESWSAKPEPGSERVLARGVRDLLGQQLDLLQWPLEAASSPGPAARQVVGGAMRAFRALDQLLRAAPTSVLNGQLSPLRRLAWAQRPLQDLLTIKRAYGTTVNDVILAAVAGGVRSYLLRRGEEPVALKVMVPVSVRSPDDVLGNHISFVFADLPCHEPDPVGRLYEVHASMSRAKRDGEPEGSDLVLKAASRTPVTVQQALSRLMSSPRAFNLVVSNIPGPTTPMYMLGCKLESVYPMVPLSENHAVSVGMLTVDEQACFGVYADRQAMPDVDVLAGDVGAAVAELLAGTARVMESPGSLLMRAHAALSEDAPLSRVQGLEAPNHAVAGGTPPSAEQSERQAYDRELQRLASDMRSPSAAHADAPPQSVDQASRRMQPADPQQNGRPHISSRPQDGSPPGAEHERPSNVLRETDDRLLHDEELAAQRERVGASGEDLPGNSAG
ncbi:MAG TPA: wax ester/triacylglycerol synthase family O-acyltransferase [Solirubrobacteraceae bacterium]|nr:wax ester/triacylglycerol synthase family O-acyltransferase [Solirubrobacteraceae bacterium]